MGNPKVTAFFHFQPGLVHDPSGVIPLAAVSKVPKGAKVKTVDRRPTTERRRFFGGDPMVTMHLWGVPSGNLLHSY